MRRVRSEITPRLRQIQAKLETLPQRAGSQFRDETPIKSGNARRNTSTVGNEIRADYAYAVRLQNGWSRQAPSGMRDPTILWINRDIRTW